MEPGDQVSRDAHGHLMVVHCDKGVEGSRPFETVLTKTYGADGKIHTEVATGPD